MYIKWYPPTNGIIKLNVDGSSKGRPPENGIDGIFRNNTGYCLLGFMGAGPTRYSTYMELCALLLGLQLA